MESPTPGRIVQFVLDPPAVTAITEVAARRRHAPPAIAVGTIAPAIVVGGSGPIVNLTVFLDGPDTHYAAGVPLDAEQTPGTWHWPARVPTTRPSSFRRPKPKGAR